jgi:hypothetical protein
VRGKKTIETVYAITSLTAECANPTRGLALSRAHWGIESVPQGTRKGVRYELTPRRELVTRREFFHTMLALTKYLLFPSWDHLLGTMAFARPPALAPGDRLAKAQVIMRTAASVLL